MKTAIAYIRVSTGKQADHGISLPAQQAKIEAYCLLHDLELLDVLQDSSSAKSIEGRPAMKQLLKYARNNTVDAVVTVKLDRMFRNTVEAITIIPELQALGVTTHIMDMGGASLDTSTPMGGFFLTVAAAFAEMERKQIGERTRTALRHKRAHGDQYSAVAPYGWMIVAGKMLQHPCEITTVQKIFECAHEGMGPTAIARWLDTCRIRPRNAQLWSPATVGKVLKHSLNTALYVNKIYAHAAKSTMASSTPSSSNAMEDRHVRYC